MAFNIKNSVQYVFSNCDSELSEKSLRNTSIERKVHRIVVPVVFKTHLRVLLLKPKSWIEEYFGEAVQEFGEQNAPRLKVDINLRTAKRRKNNRQLRSYDVKFFSQEQLVTDGQASEFVRALSAHLNRLKNKFAVEIISLKLVSSAI